MQKIRRDEKFITSIQTTLAKAREE